MEPKTRVGENIRARRLELGITQKEAAARARLHPDEFSRIERGVKDLRVSTLDRIATGLGVPAGRLVGGIGAFG